MKNLIAGFVFAALAAACGGDGIELVGKTPEQQANAIVDAFCEKEVECGAVEIDCEFVEGELDCTGEILPGDYDACYAEGYEELLADFRDCELTAEQEKLAEDCFNAMLDQSCVTQAELDAYILEIEAGDSDATLRPNPQACIELWAAVEQACPDA